MGLRKVGKAGRVGMAEVVGLGERFGIRKGREKGEVLCIRDRERFWLGLAW